MIEIPAKGDPYTIETLPGYTLVQDRPFECRPACSCGKCNGTPTNYPGIVTGVIYFADNSVEIDVACEDGETRRTMVKAPSGDVC